MTYRLGALRLFALQRDRKIRLDDRHHVQRPDHGPVCTEVHHLFILCLERACRAGVPARLDPQRVIPWIDRDLDRVMSCFESTGARSVDDDVELAPSELYTYPFSDHS